jgi:hypothetical protein
MVDPIEGGCLCGAIRYRVEAPPISASICHCATCRRAAGAQSVAWGVFPAHAFILTRGAPACYASSPGVRRSHCPACGTSLTYQNSAASIDVTLASFDDPEAIAPCKEIWTSQRLGWEPVDPDLPASPQG